MKRKAADQDSPWQEVLERYFEPFLVFFFPKAHAEIDWSKGHELLDKELQKVVRDAELGRRLADKLVKVHTREGSEAWVLVHIEVQGRQEADFAKRMYVYNYRLFDRYDRRVASFAVLTDDELHWRPSAYGYELWGCRIRLDFPTVKLLDYADKWTSLEKDPNPFSIIVMAHLKTLATRHDPTERLHGKLALVRMLYERGYAKGDILELFRFIDWVLALPEELDEAFTRAVEEYEEAVKMPYMTSVERVGKKKGMQQGMRQGTIRGTREAVLDVLDTRFGIIPPALVSAINAMEDQSNLKRLLKEAVLTPSPEAFQRLLETRHR